MATITNGGRLANTLSCCPVRTSAQRDEMDRHPPAPVVLLNRPRRRQRGHLQSYLELSVCALNHKQTRPARCRALGSVAQRLLIGYLFPRRLQRSSGSPDHKSHGLEELPCAK